MRIFRNRLMLHIVFWAGYFSITFFNELYLTSDFAQHASLNGLGKTFFSEFNLLLIKMALVYYAIYSFIPRWLKGGNRSVMTLEGLAILIATVFLYRTVIQYINWRLIFHDAPVNLTGFSLVARYLYSLLDLLQILGIAVAGKLFTLRISAVEQEKELVREKMRSEIMHLKSQINPHFLFNMLNSIYSLSKIGSPRTPDVVNRLSTLLRYMLYESEKALTSIEEETKIVDEYIELQQLRFENRVRIEKHIDLDIPQASITPLLILPLIENAYKHGVGTREDRSFIYIDIKLHDSRLEVEVKNSRSNESVKLKGYDGIGINNIRRRMELLYKDHSFDIIEDESSFTVLMKINMNSYAGIELFDSRG